MLFNGGVVFAGGIWRHPVRNRYLLRNHSTAPNYHIFLSVESDLRTIRGIIAGMPR